MNDQIQTPQTRIPPTTRERPILFSGAMVRAILAGRKTQTRRAVTDYTSVGNAGPSRCDLTKAWADPGPSPAGNEGPYLHAPVVRPEDTGCVERIYPRLWLGDRLWVRECFSHREYDPEIIDVLDPMVWYWADGSPNRFNFTKPKPSIFMPRWASRITLEITEIRVERVQDISADDVTAEGLPHRQATPDFLIGSSRPDYRWYWGFPTPSYNGFDDFVYDTDHKRAYRDLWDRLNEDRGYGWDTNPWVWVIEFRRVEAVASVVDCEPAVEFSVAVQ